MGAQSDSPRMYIGGRWAEAEGGATYPVVNPATEQVIGHAPNASRADMQRAIAAAKKAFDEGPWPRMTGRERSRIIRQIADGLARRKEELRRVLVAEAGTEHFLLGDMLDTPLNAMYQYAELAITFEFEEMMPVQVVPGPAGPVARYKMVNRQPRGVCGLIPTWNSPIHVTLHKVGPALATGCTMVVKAPPWTPLINLEIARVIDETELPKGVVSVVTGEGVELGEELVASPLVEMVSFTGSVPTGKRIAESAARTLKRVHLELGGKSAGIVLDDVDLAEVAPFATGPVYRHVGQSCAAATRCLLPAKLYDRGVAEMAKFVGGLKVGAPTDPSVMVGPLIREERRRAVEGYIRSGLEEGAKVAVGGRRPPHLSRGYFVEPTVFAEVSNTMRIAREEIFGPVLSVLRYSDVEEAIRIANDSSYGLGGAVYTRDAARGLEVARRLRTGTVSILSSRRSAGGAAQFGPFGGFKESGIGREGGKWGVAEYTELQAITW